MNKKNRQIWFAVSCLIWTSNTFPATQGTPGSTSSGSFSITLIIHPTLESSIEQNDSGIADSITTSEATDFCVSGRGISQYSLSATARAQESQGFINPDYELTHKSSAGKIATVTKNSPDKFRVVADCESSSGQLSLQVNALQDKESRTDNLPEALNLTIHAE